MLNVEVMFGYLNFFSYLYKKEIQIKEFDYGRQQIRKSKKRD